MKGHFSKILCVINDTHEQETFIRHAMHVANSHQAELTVMLALEALPPNANLVMESFSYIDSQQSMQTLAQNWLDETHQTLSSDYAFSTHLSVGHPVIDVVHHVIEHKFDLVMKQSDDSILDRLFGGDDIALIRKCPCAVWVAPKNQSSTHKTVVAAVDLNLDYDEDEAKRRDELNHDIVQVAAQAALREFAQLHIVHVFDALPSSVLRAGLIAIDNEKFEGDLAKIRQQRQASMDRLIDDLAQVLTPETMEFLKPTSHVVHGDANAEIAATAASLNSDLVVMGTVTRTSIPGFTIGGTAEDTLHRLKCGVLGVKPRDFVSPLAD